MAFPSLNSEWGQGVAGDWSVEHLPKRQEPTEEVAKNDGGMPSFLRSFLAGLTREQATEMSAWLVRDWKEKAPHYPLSEMVKVAGGGA